MMTTDSIVHQVTSTRLLSPTASLLLFGSAARGTATAHSDIDILIACPERANSGVVEVAATVREAVGPAASITFYSIEQLAALVAKGSIFILHLQREGRVLVDPAGRLREILNSRNAIQYEYERRTLRSESAVLYARDLTPERPVAVLVARHLLRRAVYLECARRGSPRFDIESVATILRDRSIVEALDPRGGSSFSTVLSTLARYVGRPGAGRSLYELSCRSSTARMAAAVLRDAEIVGYSDSAAPAAPQTLAPAA